MELNHFHRNFLYTLYIFCTLYLKFSSMYMKFYYKDQFGQNNNVGRHISYIL